MKLKKKTKPFAHKFLGKLVITSGITRSGKAMMQGIVASMKNVEKSCVNFELEQANMLSYIKKIDSDSFIYLLRRSVLMLSYNLAISREVNMRRNDFTSIYNYQNTKLYLKRLKDPEGDVVFKSSKIKKMTIPLMMHNSMLNVKSTLNAFDNVKIIEMIKNPIELVYSWINKKYGGNFWQNPRVTSLTLNYKNNIVPYYANGWEKKYLKLNAAERIVEIIYKLTRQRQNIVKQISKKHKKKILFVYFDKFVHNTNSELKIISKFLNKKTSTFTNKILKKERCPRKIDKKSYENKKKFLFKNLSKYYYKKLLILESEYLKNAQ